MPKQEDEWATCCSRTNPAFVKYIVQAVMAAGMMAFCMTQLSQKDQTSKELYWGALCSILFTFMPHPSTGVGRVTKLDLIKELDSRLTATPQVAQLADDDQDS